MQDVIINIMNQWGYLGVFFLIAVENIFPPIPSEVILLFGGALTASALGGKLGVFGMIVAATLGAVVGAVALYYVGLLLKKDRLKKIVAGKTGKILRLKPSDIEKADNWFDNKGNISVLICRCVPLLRSLISIPAGMSEMPFVRFLAYTTIGSAVWNTILVGIGHSLGSSWQSIMDFFDQYSRLVVVILALVFVGAVSWWFGFKGRSARHRKTNVEAKDEKPVSNRK